MRRRTPLLLVAAALVAAALPARAPAGGDEKNPVPEFAGKPVDWWIGELPSERTREVAREALRAIGSPAAPALARALSDPREAVRAGAADLLDRISWSGDEILAELLKALGDPSPQVRRSVLRGLHHVSDGRGRAVTPKVLPVLVDEDVGVRREAARFASRFPLDDEASIARYIASLRDVDVAVRESIAGALAGIGPKAAPAVDALLALSHDGKISVRQTVHVALTRSGSRRADVLKVFLDAARDAVRPVRISVFEGLGNFAATSDDALLALGVALDAEDADERVSAMRSLARAGPRAARFLPEFVAAIVDDRPEGYGAGVEAIASLGEAAAPALPLLVRAAVARRDSTTRILHELAATHAKELLDTIGSDPTRRDVVLEALDGVRPGSLRDAGPEALAVAAATVVDGRVSRPTKALALGLLPRIARDCPALLDDTARAAVAFLAAAVPSPHDSLGEAWLLIEDRERRFRDAGGPGPTWSIAVLGRAIADAEVPADRRVEAIRLLARLANGPSGDARKALEAAAAGHDAVIAAAATEALARLRARERR